VSSNKLMNVAWYSDPIANQRGEPGIYHSYMASLASALNYVTGELDAAWLMGSSAFAFRIFINEVMCPSAMSVFNWSSVLPEAVRQAGYDCIYVSRMWDETEEEEEKRKQAHTAIVEGIDRGVPAVVWDIADCEWGLVIGYHQENRAYKTLTCRGKPAFLPFNKLGKNGIDILSVAIPGEPSRRSREEVVLNSLKAAVAHAEQKEWTDRPEYQNGLPAFDLWALLFERWALLLEAGKGPNIPADMPDHSRYHAGHHYSARCYARDYLKTIAGGNGFLNRASRSYAEAASCLKPVWDHFSENRKTDEGILRSFSQNVKDAKTAEEEGIGHIKEYLRGKT
jgi:hypothetical protein